MKRTKKQKLLFLISKCWYKAPVHGDPWVSKVLVHYDEARMRRPEVAARFLVSRHGRPFRASRRCPISVTAASDHAALVIYVLMALLLQLICSAFTTYIQHNVSIYSCAIIFSFVLYCHSIVTPIIRRPIRWLIKWKNQTLEKNYSL